MKTRRQPLLPGRPGIGRLRKEPVGHVEKPGAGLQLFVTPTATTLGGADRMRLCPTRQQVRVQSLGALGDQRGDRWPLPVPIQSPQGPCAESAQPAVQSRRMRMATHEPHRLPQADRGPLRIGIRRAGRFHHRARVALVGRDLDRQNPKAFPADLAPTQWHRRLTILNAATARPPRAPCHPPAQITQHAHRPATRTRNLPADRLAFDRRSLQGIIGDGDGNWDSTLSGSPRGTGARTPVPHFLQKARTLSPQPAPRKQVVHNRARMSMSFSISSSGNPEPVRRDCQ
jgi:hypothetical protein